MIKKLFSFIFSLFAIALNAQTDHFETIVYENDEWSYFVGTSQPPFDWNKNNFDDSNWEVGEGGFGYGDGDDNTIIPNTTSLFIRRQFEIIEKSVLTKLLLDIDYDDAFVAYLNGIEIARSGIEGNPPTFNQFGTSHEALIKDGLAPERYEVSNQDLNSILQNGENVLAIQVHNASANSSDLSIRPFLSAGIAVSNQIYGETHQYFLAPLEFTTSNLPIFLIETEGNGGIPDEPKIKAQLSIINNSDGSGNEITDPANIYNGQIGIETRGNYSASLPQKPYSFETRDLDGNDFNVSILDMPEENDWILLANYNDKVLMRNVLSFYLFNQMGHYAPRTQFCEVWLNGIYQGIYIFTEKIKQDKNRIDIANLTEDENAGDDLTGGYIIKNDYYKQDGSDSWLGDFAPESLPAKEVRFVYHDPKASKITAPQKQYIKDYISGFESVLYGSNFKDPNTGYRSYIDVPSFIDYLIISELSRNVDAYKKSKFYFKDKDSKGGLLHSGPVWDFDWAYKNIYGDLKDGSGWAHISNEWMYPTPNGWIERMLKDPWFYAELGNRYHELRSTYMSNEAIFEFIDKKNEELGNAPLRHYSKWPILGINVGTPEGNENQPLTFSGEIDKFKSWLEKRLIWLDGNMPEAGLIPEEEPNDDDIIVRIFPNPSSDYIYAEASKKISSIKIYNIQGQLVYYENQIFSYSNKISVRNLQKGWYLIKLEIGNDSPKVRKFLRN